MTIRDYQFYNCGKSEPELHRDADRGLPPGAVCGQCAKEYYEAAHARTQADAAAMRQAATGIVNALASKDARELMHRDASFADHYKSLRMAVSGDTGRALAERVTRLEDFAREFLATEPQRRTSPSLTVAAQAALDESK
jgi:hypothetical protein